jgi:ABC-2 type transport system ATP-binding protein
MEWAIAAKQVYKTYRSGFWSRGIKPVLQGLDLTVSQGSIFGVLGPNGAGKTTLISILATLLQPDAGQVTVLGLDVGQDGQALRERINLASGAAKFIWSLTAVENLRFYGRLYGMSGRLLNRRLEEVIELFELQPHRNIPFEQLSSGLKQRLALAKALINKPELLFLDEPTSGLDPTMAQRTRKEIQRLNQTTGLTILLTTHNMREAEELCDEVAFLGEGVIQARGSVSSLQSQLAMGDRVILTYAQQPADFDYNLLPGVLSAVVNPLRVELIIDDAERRLPAILHEVQRRGPTPERVQLREVDLEDLYREFTR